MQKTAKVARFFLLVKELFIIFQWLTGRPPSPAQFGTEYANYKHRHAIHGKAWCLPFVWHQI